jgi:hypothetical protein
MKIKFLLSAIFLFLFFVQFTFSQIDEKFDFYARGDYRAEVPRPRAVLGYDAGEFHTNYALMEKYIEAVRKAAPDRVKIFDIGQTNEYRMQHLVAISSPANIARLESIRADNAKLAAINSNSTEISQIVKNSPATAWLAYTIHGNESASFEAMLQVIYQLAASNEPQTLEILNNCVTLILTGENPDGHERFVTWYNSVGSGNADRFAIEHREPWSIWGRFNHFRFDLNRDNIAATQIETQNMQKAFFEWNPQVLVDHHGQPSQFFFPPAALPINPNLPQPATNIWLDMFGRANAKAFDANKWDYYVRDIFDLFYPGYWDSFPSLNGAIGMTYETDGGGFKGLRWTRDDGTIVTLRSAVAKHFVASMTTLETLAKNRELRLTYYYNFRNDDALFKAEKLKRIVILPEKDRVKTAEMMEILQRAKIEIKVANASFSSQTAHSYMQKNAPAAAKTFPAGAYIIDLNQAQRRLIKALLEQDTPQDDAFVKDNLRKFKRNEMRGASTTKEDYGFYDITAWSLPLAFGVDAYWTEDAPAVSSSVVTAEFLQNAKRGSLPARASIAYIIPYKTDAAGAFAIRLLKEGFRVAVAMKPLTAGGKTYERGTFVVRLSRNPDAVHDAVARLARELGVDVFAANSGYTDDGDTNVGSENVVSLQPPRVAMLADEVVDQTSFGSIWWTLNRYGIEFTPISIGAIKSGALRNYSVLIMPNGSAARYFGDLGAGGVSNLKSWIAGGGTLITVRGASVFTTLKDVALSSSKMVGSEDDEEKGKTAEDEEETDKRKETEEKPLPTPSPTPTRTPLPAASPSPIVEPPTDKKDWQADVLPPIASPSANAGKVPEGVPGAIMRATVDRTTYLTYGLESDELPVLLASGFFFRISKEGSNALVFERKPKTPLTISGFVWEDNTERLLKGTAYVIDEPSGAGHVILFAEEPFFRGIFRSTTRPFFNSILFNGVF